MARIKNKSRKNEDKIVLKKEVLLKALSLKCDDERSKQKLKDLLIKFPFCKDGDVSSERLEKVVMKLEDKYEVLLSYISRHNFVDHEGKHINQFSGMMKDREHFWIGNIYGCTVWEVLAKASIAFYYYAQQYSEEGFDGVKQRKITD